VQRTPSKARGLKKAEREAEFFITGGAGRVEIPFTRSASKMSREFRPRLFHSIRFAQDRVGGSYQSLIAIFFSAAESGEVPASGEVLALA